MQKVGCTMCTMSAWMKLGFLIIQGIDLSYCVLSVAQRLLYPWPEELESLAERHDAESKETLSQ